MSTDMQEYAGRVMAPITDTVSGLQNFQESLATGLFNPSSNGQPGDPYARLRANFVHLLGRHASTPGKIKRYSEEDVEEMQDNIGVGSGAIVSGLELLGKVYEHNARVPQDPANVQANADVIVRHMFGIACMNGRSAIVNHRAILGGYDPRSMQGYLRGNAAYLMKRRPKISLDAERSFKVSQDADGQITAGIRYARRQRTNAAQCPASLVKPNRAVNAKAPLFLLLQAVGNVAVDKIYPTRFAMVGVAKTDTAQAVV